MSESDNRSTRRINEVEFVQFVEMILPRLLGPGEMIRGPYHGIDLAYAGNDGSVYLIDVKNDVPATRERLQAVAARLTAVAQSWQAERMTTMPVSGRTEPVLVVNGRISEDGLRYLISSKHIRVIDSTDIYKIKGREYEANETSNSLLRMLNSISAGTSDALRYQQVVRHILEYLLCPPLNNAIYEHSNATGTNRRDMIFPNYSDESFWRYMRETYAAHYLVVDAKNYSRKVKKNDVLQISNYLNRHGTGLFGMIVTRNSDDAGAVQTRREQWITHGKLVIVLNNSDLRQMLATKADGDDPAMQIRQIIEDFRISF